MIGLILGGVLGIQGLEKQVKEDVQVDLFFNSELNEADIKLIEIEMQQWSEFSEVYFVSPERAMQEFEGVGAEKEEMICFRQLFRVCFPQSLVCFCWLLSFMPQTIFLTPLRSLSAKSLL